MKYIDADKLRAEIERQSKSIENATGDFAEGRRLEQRVILSFLDTLEEPVSEDLEEEISTWIPAHISGGDNKVWKDAKAAIIEWAGIVAHHFAEWQYQKDRAEFAKLKAREWINGYNEGLLAKGKED